MTELIFHVREDLVSVVMGLSAWDSDPVVALRPVGGEVERIATKAGWCGMLDPKRPEHHPKGIDAWHTLASASVVEIWVEAFLKAAAELGYRRFVRENIEKPIWGTKTIKIRLWKRRPKDSTIQSEEIKASPVS